MDKSPERSRLILQVKITPDVISFLIKNYNSAAIGVNEIKFSSIHDMNHFIKEYLNE